MQLPIDTTSIKLEVTSEPKPVTSFESNAPKLDPKGRPLFAIRVLWDDGRSTEMITIKVPGPVATLGHRAAVKVTGLIAAPYVVNGKDGISFFAESIEAVSTSSKAA